MYWPSIDQQCLMDLLTDRPIHNVRVVYGPIAKWTYLQMDQSTMHESSTDQFSSGPIVQWTSWLCTNHHRTVEWGPGLCYTPLDFTFAFPIRHLIIPSHSLHRAWFHRCIPVFCGCLTTYLALETWSPAVNLFQFQLLAYSTLSLSIIIINREVIARPAVALHRNFAKQTDFVPCERAPGWICRNTSEQYYHNSMSWAYLCSFTNDRP